MSLKQGKVVHKKQDEPLSPQRKDEQSISGHMAGMESDDNVKESAKKVGLYGDEGEKQPEEVGVAEEVDEAEEDRRRGKDEREVAERKVLSRERVEMVEVDEDETEK